MTPWDNSHILGPSCAFAWSQPGRCNGFGGMSFALHITDRVPKPGKMQLLPMTNGPDAGFARDTKAVLMLSWDTETPASLEKPSVRHADVE